MIRVPLRGWYLAALISALITTQSAAIGQAPTPPTVTGPIAAAASPGDPGHNYIFFSTPMDLKSVGYVEEEYFVGGTATRYVIPDGPGDMTSPGTMPYRTRIVVRRPATAATFKGVVVVEWRNASAGTDGDGGWATSGELFVRDGWAWVGASVQMVNVHGFPPPHPLAGQGLKQWSPMRYGQLDVTNNGAVTDDSQAYDIYTQIAQLLKHPGNVDPFGGMRVQRVYASGGSQSARFLVRYYNYIQPQTNAFDGFMATMGGEAPRLNQRTKIFKLYTESDVARQAPIRVANSATTHTWEIAGAPHMPSIFQSSDRNDFRGTATALRDLGAGFPPAQCARPWPSPVENWMVMSAAMTALDRWVATGTSPATTAPIETTGASNQPLHTIVRDERGIARGGIRLPAVAMPTALVAGDNQPASPDPVNGVCVFVGTRVPFDAAMLASMYPDRAAYSRAVRRIVDDLVKQEIVLKEDAATLVQRAEAALPK
jgi:hypothetical protein